MFQSIALGGGGVRGGLHVGALLAIEQWRGNLTFKSVYGSSVGSILATAVAFGMNARQIESMFLEHFNLGEIVPPLRLTSITSINRHKGMFSMDSLEGVLLKAFDSQGVDLRGKKIADAPQKLYIVASNMTTRNITLLSGDVSVVEAIKCSSCLPFVFHPQVLYNQVYLDGGIYVDNLCDIVPKDCLVLHISASADRLFPADLAGLSFASYLHILYRSIRVRTQSPNMIWLRNDTINILQDLKKEDKELMTQQGRSQTTAWLTKRASEELM